MIDMNELATMEAGDLADVVGERFYKVEEVAAWLRTSPRKVYNLVEQGEMPSRRIGRLIRIPLSGLRTWQARQES